MLYTYPQHINIRIVPYARPHTNAAQNEGTRPGLCVDCGHGAGRVQLAFYPVYAQPNARHMVVLRVRKGTEEGRVNSMLALKYTI